jgi:hypothetical protein
MTMKVERKSSLAFDDPFTIALIIVVGVVIASAIIVYGMRKSGRKVEKNFQEDSFETEFRPSPFKIEKSILREEASRAKDELRILDLERGILSDAIRRLYEAHAEGKISEEERERLGETYKSRMMTVKDAISKDESVVALHELEAMQEDLVKLFSERFDELNSKIGELRSKVEVLPIKEIPVPIVEEQPAETVEEKSEVGEKARKKRRQQAPKQSPKTEAERRIEEIRSEVEKVLDRLGQMELET